MKVTQISISLWIDDPIVVYPCNEMSFHPKGEPSTGTCKSMDEPWKHAQWKESATKDHVLMVPLIWNVQNRPIPRDRKVSGCHGIRKRGMGLTTRRYGVFLLLVIKMFCSLTVVTCRTLQATQNVHATTEVPALKMPEVPSDPPTTHFQTVPSGVALGKCENLCWDTEVKSRGGPTSHPSSCPSPHSPHDSVPRHRGFCWAKSKVLEPPRVS